MASEASVHHPIFARLFAWGASNAPAEQTEHRRGCWQGLSGRVIEVGAGNGLNFPHYPPEVTEVLAVEPEPYLRGEGARRRPRRRPVPVRVVDGLADSLPAEDASFDAGVASLVLCSVPDQAVALAELRRVIRPGGELRFYEHVRAQDARPRAQPGPDRPALAALLRRLPSEPRHPGLDRGGRVRDRALRSLQVPAVGRA